MRAPTVLVVEDDPKAAQMLQRALTYEGYHVLSASNGREALDQARDHNPDLVVLDWNIPALDGLSVLERLRNADSTPVLMLTGRADLDDKVRALSTGADDYLVKPFAPEEFVARVRALLRRAALAQLDRPLSFADLVLDMRTHEARRRQRALSLSPREFELLAYFMRRPGQVLRREQILRDVWGYDAEDQSGVLDVYIGYLRAKLERNGEPRLIHTVRHVGYVLREP
ncbi:MAG: response regulator transcription factor [Anaerolineae bacterium]|nr:response regulator transcription factor [Candidatus Roseilinea sp.]MDW8450738.1 response regulator transcription factor [Anaerolineae bacterium]